jgi:hypothetical protein
MYRQRHKKDWTSGEWRDFTSVMQTLPVNRLIAIEKELVKEMFRRIVNGGLSRDEAELLKESLEGRTND